MASKYYLKRVLHSILVFVLVVTLAFVMFRLMPFGPVEMVRLRLMEQMSRSGAYSQQRAQRINQLVQLYTSINPQKPIPIAYLQYLRDVILYQDLGKSFNFNAPVTQILLTHMQWSIFISVYGLALGKTVGLLFGASMAYNEGSRFDKAMTGITILNRSIPFYVVGIVLLIIFAYNFGWLPDGGLYNRALKPGFNLPFMISILRHATLPVLASFVAAFGGALAYRGNCVRELGEGYIRVAHLRGISDTRIAIRYVGRNSLLPIYTSLMMSVATVFSSSIILETIFDYPGMGYVMFKALQNRDMPLLMGAFMFFTFVTLLGILIADLTYGIIDPRVKGGEEREAF
jgi:peptide/nickel transport system permease protein